MTVVRPHGAIRPGLPTILDGHDTINRQRHDLSQRFANLIFCHAIVTRKLEHLGEWSRVLRQRDTHTRHIRSVCGRADRPVVHVDLLLLGLPQGVDEDIDGRLGVVVVRHRVAVQHGDAQGCRARVFLHGALAVEFRLPVDVGRLGRRTRRVRCLAPHPREHVVRRDVDQLRRVRRRRLRQVFRGCDVQNTRGVGVSCARVGLSVCGACGSRVLVRVAWCDLVLPAPLVKRWGWKGEERGRGLDLQ